MKNIATLTLVIWNIIFLSEIFIFRDLFQVGWKELRISFTELEYS